MTTALMNFHNLCKQKTKNLRKEDFEMKISKNKNRFARFVTALISSIMLMVVFSFSTVSAMAAEETPSAAVAVRPAMTNELLGSVADMPETAINAAAKMPTFIKAATDLDSKDDGDAQFESVVKFFVKWIKRVGLLVAFVGGVMFALAIKNNDAEQKQAGLLTLVAGFVVSALCQAVDMFNIFS